jgi:hypothetical protein
VKIARETGLFLSMLQESLSVDRGGMLATVQVDFLPYAELNDTGKIGPGRSG